MTVPLSQLLNSLQDAAEKATPGPRRVVEDAGSPLYDVPHPDGRGYLCMSLEHADAAFIAAVSPEVVHALAEVTKVATGEVRHVYAGLCPEDWAEDQRDPDCPACSALARLWETLRKEDGDD